MFKILFAIAFLSGSMCSIALADDYSNTNDSSRSNSYDSSYNAGNPDNKVTGTVSSTSMSETKYRALHVGLLSGISSPNGGANSSAQFGADVGYQPYANIGAGLEASTAKLDDATKRQRTAVLAKSQYVMGGDVPVLKDSYLGAAAGPLFLSNVVRWGVAPMAGFDIPLSSSSHDFVSLGLNAKYLFVNKTPNAFLTAAALKYWF
jgi:hypothetical protein